jgi:predicted ATP-grasp superfamily ATP-dependent carboligase
MTQRSAPWNKLNSSLSLLMKVSYRIDNRNPRDVTPKLYQDVQQRYDQADQFTVMSSNDSSMVRATRSITHSWVADLLSVDATFRAVQDIALNEKAIASAESSIKTYEEELLKLEKIKPLDSGLLSTGATRQRAAFLLKKMRDAETKIEKLEEINTKLKKSLKVQKK